MMTSMRTWTEMARLDTFAERFQYLKLNGSLGRETFGHDRWMNQRFYTSREWKLVRSHVIARDLACDLAVEGLDIHGKVIIHHMNPMKPADLIDMDEIILDPEFLVCASHQTHNAIHFGDERALAPQVVDRQPGDTKLW